jgi:hypothetical protein
MTTPDTVTEAVEFLATQGYVDDYRVGDAEVAADGMRAAHAMEGAVIDFMFRFEGPSDPSDEAIVLGVSHPGWARKGIVVSAYGPDAERDAAAVLVALSRDR